MLLDQNNETKLVPASFSYFLKVNFSLKSVIGITAMISLHVKNPIKLFYLLCSSKKVVEESN